MNFKTANSLNLETFCFPPSFISKSVGELRCTADSCLVFCSVPSCSLCRSAEYLKRAPLDPGSLTPRVLSGQTGSAGPEAPSCARVPARIPLWAFMELSRISRSHKEFQIHSSNVSQWQPFGEGSSCMAVEVSRWPRSVGPKTSVPYQHLRGLLRSPNCN